MSILRTCLIVGATSLTLLGCANRTVGAGADRTPAAAAPRKLRVYFGTYTRRGGSKGIYLSQLDLTTGTLTAPILAAATDNPTFLALSPDGRFLYAAGGSVTVHGARSGAVTAFAIDPATGKLTLLNRKSSGGKGPCHVVVDATGRHALAANYSSGSVVSLPIARDGRLGPAASVVQHKGSSANKRRQSGPHAHSINLDAANRFAFAADLGADKLFVYRFDPAAGTLKPHDPPAVTLAPGAGPRHFAFHPGGRFAYVINELHSTVTAMAYDRQAGTLTELHTVTTLPGDFTGPNSTAEVQVHPSGRFVYGSNRGHDSLAIFAVDAKTGRLKPLGHQSVGGRTPRNFGIDPTGRYILAANQNSNTVVVFRVDPATGRLTPNGSRITVSSPVCVKFATPPAETQK